MIIISSVWENTNAINLTMDVHIPPININIGGNMTPISINTPTINMTFANLGFGKATTSVVCDSFNISYDESRFYESMNLSEKEFTKLLDIKWYKKEVIHFNSDLISYLQGFISNNINHPITIRNHNGLMDIGFLYGDCFPLPSALKGACDNVELSQHWWMYIQRLMKEEVFENNVHKKLNEIIIGVYEKNGFETKG